MGCSSSSPGVSSYWAHMQVLEGLGNNDDASRRKWGEWTATPDKLGAFLEREGAGRVLQLWADALHKPALSWEAKRHVVAVLAAHAAVLPVAEAPHVVKVAVGVFVDGEAPEPTRQDAARFLEGLSTTPGGRPFVYTPTVLNAVKHVLSSVLQTPHVHRVALDLAACLLADKSMADAGLDAGLAPAICSAMRDTEGGQCVAAGCAALAAFLAHDAASGEEDAPLFTRALAAQCPYTRFVDVLEAACPAVAGDVGDLVAAPSVSADAAAATVMPVLEVVAALVTQSDRHVDMATSGYLRALAILSVCQGPTSAALTAVATPQLDAIATNGDVFHAGIMSSALQAFVADGMESRRHAATLRHNVESRALPADAVAPALVSLVADVQGPAYAVAHRMGWAAVLQLVASLPADSGVADVLSVGILSLRAPPGADGEPAARDTLADLPLHEVILAGLSLCVLHTKSGTPAPPPTPPPLPPGGTADSAADEPPPQPTADYDEEVVQCLNACAGRFTAAPATPSGCAWEPWMADVLPPLAASSVEPVLVLAATAATELARVAPRGGDALQSCRACFRERFDGVPEAVKALLETAYVAIGPPVATPEAPTSPIARVLHTVFTKSPPPPPPVTTMNPLMASSPPAHSETHTNK